MGGVHGKIGNFPKSWSHGNSTIFRTFVTSVSVKENYSNFELNTVSVAQKIQDEILFSRTAFDPSLLSALYYNLRGESRGDFDQDSFKIPNIIPRHTDCVDIYLIVLVLFCHRLLFRLPFAFVAVILEPDFDL